MLGLPGAQSLFVSMPRSASRPFPTRHLRPLHHTHLHTRTHASGKTSQAHKPGIRRPTTDEDGGAEEEDDEEPTFLPYLAKKTSLCLRMRKMMRNCCYWSAAAAAAAGGGRGAGRETIWLSLYRIFAIFFNET